MKIYVLVTFVFITSIIFCCKQNTTKMIDPKKEHGRQFSVQECLDKKDKEKIIEAIMATSDFQMFLHPNVEGRLPVQLVKNEFVTSDLNIFSNGFQVQFVDSLTLPEGKEHQITLGKIDCTSSKISYSIYYPIEGVIISGKILKKDGSWIAIETTWGEM